MRNETSFTMPTSKMDNVRLGWAQSVYLHSMAYKSTLCSE